MPPYGPVSQWHLRSGSRPPAGYEPAQHAVLVSHREPNLVNIQLVPVPNPQSVISPAAVTAPSSAQNEGSHLLAEVEKLKALLMANPEERLSLPLIREKLRVQEELTKALREELKEVKDQNKWYLGSMIAIVIGFLAIIATLFVGQKRRPIPDTFVPSGGPVVSKP